MRSANRPRRSRAKTCSVGLRTASGASKALQARSFRDMRAIRNASGGLVKPRTTRADHRRSPSDHRRAERVAREHRQSNAQLCQVRASWLASLWEFHQAADPSRIATRHDGCGAAIRVAPVGIFYASNRLDDLVNGAREASISTHGGSVAIAAAAAVAAAVSAAIDGVRPRQVLDL